MSALSVGMTTHGTWKRNNDSITACYFEEGFTRLSNSRGESWVVEDAEWESRFRNLEQDGWKKS